MAKPDELDVIVLLSVASHPLSLRACRNSSDESAIELALRQTNSTIELVHAGTSDNEQVLRDYIGMGVSPLTLLQLEHDGDPLHVLSSYLGERSPDLIITGDKCSGGEDSGLIPYYLAEELNYNIIANICEIEEVTSNDLSMLIALPRGKRRRVSSSFPLVLTVSESVIIARQSSYAKSIRGTINIIPTNSQIDMAWSNWTIKQKKIRPKQLETGLKSNSNADRLAAVMGGSDINTNQLIELSSRDAAEAIISWMKKENVII